MIFLCDPLKFFHKQHFRFLFGNYSILRATAPESNVKTILAFLRYMKENEVVRKREARFF